MRRSTHPTTILKEERQHCLFTQRFSPELGGSITWLREVYERWPKEVQVITHLHEQEEEYPNLNVERHNVRLSDWGFDSFRSLRCYSRLACLARKQAQTPTTFHCAHLVPDALPALAATWLNSETRIIAYAHGEEILACETSWQLTKMLSFVGRHIDGVIANYYQTANLLAPYVDESKVKVIHPGVSLQPQELLEEKGRKWRQEYGHSEKDVILLTLGRIDGRKNQEGVLAALAELLKSFPELHYYCIGVGERRKALEEQIKAQSLSGQVHVLDPVSEEEKWGFLAGANLYVMPSIQSKSDLEGFGITFLEAGLAGVPSIAGNCGGQAEAVRDGTTGLVVDGKDPQALQKALKNLVTDHELRARFGLAARQYASEHSWELVLKKTVDFCAASKVL